MSTVIDRGILYTISMPPRLIPAPPTLLMLMALFTIPVAIWAEDKNNTVWQNRLFSPDYASEINRHTPIITAGTFLPPEITSSKTFTHSDSPLIVTGTTHIPRGVSVTIEPGVTVVAHEFALLMVDGTLIAAGTDTQPITFTTNELHPENQNWGGIIVTDSGQATVTQVEIEYASPALTCLPTSSVVADQLHTRFGLVGLHTESDTCTLKKSRLQAIQYGIVARGVEPNVTNTNITAGKQDIFISTSN